MTKNFFRVLVTLMFMLPLSFALSSCSDDDDEQVSVNMIGYWTAYDYDDYGDGGYSTYYRLKCYDDGEFDYSYSNKYESCYYNGTYKVSGNSVSFKIEYCSDPEVIGRISTGTVEGDRLTIEGLVYHRESYDPDDDEDDENDEDW